MGSALTAAVLLAASRCVSILSRRTTTTRHLKPSCRRFHRRSARSLQTKVVHASSVNDSIASAGADARAGRQRWRILDALEQHGSVRMATVMLTTESGALDIATRPDGTSGYDDLKDSFVLIEYEGRHVPVASLADVIRSKEASGREKDLRVLPALRAHMKRQRSQRLKPREVHKTSPTLDAQCRALRCRFERSHSGRGSGSSSLRTRHR